MSSLTRLIHGTVAASLACAAFSTGTVSQASSGDVAEADALAEIVAEATALAGDAPIDSSPMVIEDDVATTESEHGTVAIGLEITDGVTVSSADGLDLSIGLPSAGRADGLVADDGTVVYADALVGAALTARAGDSGVQASMVIDSADAPAEYRFDLDLPEAHTLTLNEDGSAQITGPDGLPAGLFDPPWAVDAEGQEVATWFSTDGATLIQHVEHRGAAHPVVADPKFTWGIVSGTVYFSKQETRRIAFGASLVAVGGFKLAPLAVASGILSAFANNALAANKCLKIKYYPNGVSIPGDYGGSTADGYCK